MLSSTSCSETRIPRTDGARPYPPLLFGLLVFAALAVLTSRGFLPQQESPVVFVEEPSGARVLLDAGFSAPGIHHFSDGIPVQGVNGLTDDIQGYPVPGSMVGEPFPLVDGMALSFGKTIESSREIVRGWMPARQRMALGIPLHPDRMSRDDWVALPGIGEALADRIEFDRQENGDFGRFEALERVKGIGPAKLKALRPFFDERGD